jgi:hypothetical protein
MMRFYDYLFHKRRAEANYRVMLKILISAESNTDPHIKRYGGLAQAMKFHAEDHLSHLKQLKDALDKSA